MSRSQWNSVTLVLCCGCEMDVDGKREPWLLNSLHNFTGVFILTKYPILVQYHHLVKSTGTQFCRILDLRSLLEGAVSIWRRSADLYHFFNHTPFL